MNIYFLIMVFLFNIFTSFSPAIAQTLREMNPDLLSQSYQEQETTVSLNYNQLNSPYLLSLKTSSFATKLEGKIKINGEIIKTKLNPSIVLNLSNYLNKGKNTVLITGNYSPANSSVTIKLEGDGTSVTQTTGGNGQIQQTITIYVR